MAEQKTDRYGFFTQDRPKSKEEIKAIEEDEKDEPFREKVWQTIVSSWDTSIKKNRNDIAAMIKRGVPDTMRGIVWGLILDIEHFPPSIDFQELITREELPFTVTIKKDLDRSLPKIKDFSEKKKLDYLKNILYAIGFQDPELGYTQGMNFIAALLLHYLEEEQAFKCFYQILNGQRTMHRNFFITGFPRLEVANKMLEILLKKYYPRILKNLNEQDIMFNFFSSGWFMTAFMSFTWDSEFQMRIFERFLFYGLRGLLGLAMAIFSRHKDILSTSKSMEVILSILQKPDQSERMFDWHYVLKKWDEHWIKKAEYLKLLKAVGEQPEPML